MKYVELNSGAILLCPSFGYAHSDMIASLGVSILEVKSAGFISMISEFDMEEGVDPLDQLHLIKAYGDSVSLKKPCNEGLKIPKDLWVGSPVKDYPFERVYFSSEESLLSAAGMFHVKKAVWGYSKALSTFDCYSPIWVPKHPDFEISTQTYVRR